MMNTHWERRDRKIAKRKRFMPDNRRSVRVLYSIMLKKSREVKDGRRRIVRSPDENIYKDYEKGKSEEPK